MGTIFREQINDLVKVLGRGELTAKLAITVNAFSASAKAAIEKAGGTATGKSQIKGIEDFKLISFLVIK